MTDGLVFARETGVLVVNGLPWRTEANQPWHADDPLVKAHPNAFSDRPLQIASTELEDRDPSSPRRSVEQATRAPGEVRNLRRGR